MDMMARNAIEPVFTIPQVAKMAGWSVTRMRRLLVARNEEADGQLLVNVSRGRERPRWTCTLSALRSLAPAWFAAIDTGQEQLEWIAEQNEETRALVNALSRRVSAQHERQMAIARVVAKQPAASTALHGSSSSGRPARSRRERRGFVVQKQGGYVRTHRDSRSLSASAPIGEVVGSRRLTQSEKYPTFRGMPTKRTIFRCLIISPGDVAEEREAVNAGIADFNARFADAFGASVEAVGWERHATPEMGAEPQAIINRQIVDECDLAIAIFWTRLGTPTAEHSSGSAEEISKLRGRGAPVLVYFSDKPAEPSQIDAAQFAKLRDLRRQFQSEGLLGSFKSVPELRGQVALHLAHHVAALVARQGSDDEGARPGFVAAVLPDVRVSIELIDMLSLGRSSSKTPFIRIQVANHSPQAVFLTGPSFATKDGRWALTERDSVGGYPGKKRELAPGDSTEYLYAPKLVEQIVEGVPGDVVVHDAIQRRYRAPSGSLAVALSKHVASVAPEAPAIGAADDGPIVVSKTPRGL